MKTRVRFLLKQSLKYFFIVLIFFIGLALYRLTWSIPDQTFYMVTSVAILILIVSFVFDAISVRDILPIFKN